MVKQCEHKHFDFTQTSGNGFVRCADCGKSIPVERALTSLDERVRRLEKFMRAEIIKDRDMEAGKLEGGDDAGN